MTKVYSSMKLIALLLVVSCAGEIERNPIADDTPPVLQSFSPVDGTVGQPINVRIELYFDDLMLLGSCNSNNFYMIKDGSAQKIAVKEYRHASGSDGMRTLFLYPLSNLEPNTLYRVVVDGGPSNQGGQPFIGTNWMFRTGVSTTNYLPQVEITSPTNTQCVKDNIVLQGTFVGDSLYYSIGTESDWVAITNINGNNWSSPAIDVTKLPFHEGDNNVYVRVKRDTTQESMIKQIAVKVDTKVPTVSITSHSQNSSLSGVVTISGKATDDNPDYVKIFLDNQVTLVDATANGFNNWSYVFDTKVFDNGNEYIITIQAIDKAGNVGRAFLWHVNIVN